MGMIKDRSNPVFLIFIIDFRQAIHWALLFDWLSSLIFLIFTRTYFGELKIEEK